MNLIKVLQNYDVMTVTYYAEGHDSRGIKWSTYEKNNGRPMTFEIDPNRWHFLSLSDKDRVMKNDASNKFPEVDWERASQL